MLAPGDGWSLAVSVLWRDPGQVRVLRAVLEPGGRGAAAAVTALTAADPAGEPGGGRPPGQYGPVDDAGEPQDAHGGVGRLGARASARRPSAHEAVLALGRRENREARAVLLALFEALAEGVPHAAPGPDGESVEGRPLLVGARNTAAAVNTLWAAAELLGAGAVPGLARILDRALTEPWTLESGRVRDACTAGLAALSTPEAGDALLEASRRAPTKALREQILTVLDRAGRAGSMPPSRLAELHISDHGLNGGGRRLITVRKHDFELSLRPDGRVDVLARDEVPLPDAAVDRGVAAEARSLRAAYDRELIRIEALLATGRSWTYEEWRRVYLDNPVTRAVAARLIWRMEHRGGWIVDVLPSSDGGIAAARAAYGNPASDGDAASGDVRAGAEAWEALDGRAAGTAGGGMPETVRLWHPRDADPGGLAAWRTIRDRLHLVQPFAQLDRDFTRGDPDPDAAELNQYTGTAVGDPEDFAAAVARLGWHMRSTKPAPGSDAVRLVHRLFPDDGLTVAVPCREEPGHGDGSRPGEGRIVLGAGWFHRAEDRARTPLALGYVPPRLYSEALREIAVLARSARGGDEDETVADRVGH